MTKTTTSWKIATLVASLAVPANGLVPMLPGISRVSNTELKTLSSFNEHPDGEEVLANCNLPGNFGFDPLHLAQSPQQLVTYRKAEVKHSRIAILAVLMIMWNDFQVVDNLGATPFFEG